MNNQRALTRLTAYVEGRLEADDRIDVEALLEQYLEGVLDPELARHVSRPSRRMPAWPRS